MLSLWPIAMDTNNPANESKLEASVQSKLEHVHERVTIGLGFTSDWLREWRGMISDTKLRNEQLNEIRITQKQRLRLAPNMD